jgi:hypothetical protein
MEGLQNITVTTMGGGMVLIHSSKIGELERMIKAKEEWLSYYFFDIRPWSPNMVNVNREVWVKVFGIPLHAWGDNLFKVLGARFGMFVDYDEPTASKARLDVAHIKLSTSIRTRIETPVMLSVMGVAFEVWVVEDEVGRRLPEEGERVVEGDRSLGGSSEYPRKAVVACGDEFSVSGEEGEGSVDMLAGQNQDSPKALERVNTNLLEQKVQNDFSSTVQVLPLEIGRLSQVEKRLVTSQADVREESGAQGGEVSREEELRVAVNDNGVKNSNIEGEKMKVGCGNGIGPSGLDFLLQNEDLEGDDFCGELGTCGGPTQNRPNRDDGVSGSENPNRVLEIVSNQCHIDNLLSNSIEPEAVLPTVLKGDIAKNQNLVEFSNLSESSHQSEKIGPSILPNLKKQVVRNKFPHGCGPKFLKLVEAVKDGGGGVRRRRTRGSVETRRSRSVPAKQGGRIQNGAVENSETGAILISTTHDEDSIEGRNFNFEGLNLEVVLPGPIISLIPETNGQQIEDLSCVPESPLNSEGMGGQLVREASTILDIQKKVGFTFTSNEDTVIMNLVNEEAKDRLKMKERVQQNGGQ